MIAQNAPLDPLRGKWPATAAELPFDLRQLRIMVIHPRDQDGEFLLRNLQRLRCQVDLIWPPPNKIEGAADIAFCLLRSEEHTSELQSRGHLVCRLLLEKKKKQDTII